MKTKEIKRNKAPQIKESMLLKKKNNNILELMLSKLLNIFLFSNKIPLANKPQSSLMLSVSDPQYITYTQQRRQTRTHNNI